MLFLFRSAPEVEKRIHSKLFRKFWRSRGTKEPAYITVLALNFHTLGNTDLCEIQRHKGPVIATSCCDDKIDGFVWPADVDLCHSSSGFVWPAVMLFHSFISVLGLPRPLPGRFQDGKIFRESLPLNKDNLCNHDIPIIGSCLAAQKLFLHLNIPCCNF